MGTVTGGRTGAYPGRSDPGEGICRDPGARPTVRGCTLQWALPTIGRVEVLANVVLFVAPVFLTAAGLRRPLVAFLAGSVLSAVIEAAQAFLPGRACDPNDWMNNTIGALIGAVLAVIALRAAHVRGRHDLLRVREPARPLVR